MSDFVKVTSYREINKGALMGFLNVEIPKYHMEIQDIAHLTKDDSTWFNMPTKEYTNKDGERKFYRIINFTDEEKSKAFFAEVSSALKIFRGSPDPVAQVEEEDDGLPF